MHVDDFIHNTIYRSTDQAILYAAWVLSLFRLDAMHRMAFQKQILRQELYCTYQGNRYRVVGASRLGDIWLTTNYKEFIAYEKRVDIDHCSLWSQVP